MDAETRKALNRLAREQLKHKLLADVLMDINVCKLEGWDEREFIRELITMLEGLK